ncbi:zinc finger BED domain-containing protein RICESLEEPER 1-like [Vicia villosa]|uniref:zinc finger BED domain-containing protein RICESLEEPER 1-like n=1 Tax=Vicia villosa TaxID=3911 RepID=UPI00273AB797|nr:zinc finger BED domain-containing protein RICESLEEPER 1-like [Vicia villosa]
MGGGNFLHMRCAAHILNLVVRDGQKDHELAIGSVCDAVRFVRSSPQRALKFKECIEILGITCKKNLCLDVSTRWNSTYLMLDAAEKFEAAFEKLEDEDPGYMEFFDIYGPPCALDWEKARAFVIFFKSILSSLNMNTFVTPLVSSMLEKYDKYWGGVNKVNHFVYFGVIFDPRFKFNYIEWSFNEMYWICSDLSRKSAEHVKTSLFKLYNCHKSDHDKHVGVGIINPPSGSTFLGETSSQSKNPSYFIRTDAFKKHLKEKDTIENHNELEKYLSDSCCEDVENFNILNWWKENCIRYPILASLVREVLATPVSSVASESAFSTGGRILDMYRSSLTPEMVEALICSQNWLKPSDDELKVFNMIEEYEITDSVVSEFQGVFTGGAVAPRQAGPV